VKPDFRTTAASVVGLLLGLAVSLFFLWGCYVRLRNVAWLYLALLAVAILLMFVYSSRVTLSAPYEAIVNTVLLVCNLYLAITTLVTKAPSTNAGE
jgi:hypothetical protein